MNEIIDVKSRFANETANSPQAGVKLKQSSSKAEAKLNYSDEQVAIFEWFKSGTGNLVIKARAGTGKTTTIKAAFEHAPESRILYAVFNKKNQIEAQAKITDPRVDVRTLHSLGYRFIQNVWRGCKPDDVVEFARIDAVADLAQYPDERAMVAKLIGFAKNTFINPDRVDMQNICDERDIAFEFNDGISIALKAMELAKTPDKFNRISFNDMVWLPVACNWVRPIYNLVAIDEAQDMSTPQLSMARGASNGRVVVVGDDRQMIYSFRGCHPDGIKMMTVELDATELKLTTTYRCPKSVVKLAQQIVPDYHAADSAPDGSVQSVTDCNSAQIGDAILSRLNAPLMPLALSLLRRNIPARIEGRDIGKQLCNMIDGMKAKSVPNFFEKVEGWLTKQVARWSKSKSPEKKIEQSQDMADTLKAIADGCSSVKEIKDRIYSMFQDTAEGSKPAVVLSSVHKAKGLEWNRVFMLSTTFKKDKGIEESNIYYVAVTRAKQSLFLVGGV